MLQRDLSALLSSRAPRSGDGGTLAEPASRKRGPDNHRSDFRPHHRFLGGVLPGVTVTVVNEGTGFTDTRVTDAAGLYTFTNLRVGTYSVSAEMQGFRKEQRTGFSLTADGRSRRTSRSASVN